MSVLSRRTGRIQDAKRPDPEGSGRSSIRSRRRAGRYKGYGLRRAVFSRAGAPDKAYFESSSFTLRITANASAT